MHVDLWDPGTALSKYLSGCHILNAMCDLTQFIVSTITTETHAEHLAKVVMENVIILFVMVAILVIDTSSRFKSILKRYVRSSGDSILSSCTRELKKTSVEKYHRFINKTQAIVGQDKGTHDAFLQNTKTSKYTWNSNPSDGTDIIRSVADVVRKLRFLLDIKLLETPTTLNQGNYGMYEYL